MGLKLVLSQPVGNLNSKNNDTLEYAVVDLKPPTIYHGRTEIATILIGQRRK